jgi:hypothetical protein
VQLAGDTAKLAQPTLTAPWHGASHAFLSFRAAAAPPPPPPPPPPDGAAPPPPPPPPDAQVSVTTLARGCGARSWGWRALMHHASSVMHRASCVTHRVSRVQDWF